MNIVAWREIEKEILGKKIVCYGAGNNAYSMLCNKEFCKYQKQIAYFIDADESKYGSEIKVGDFSFLIEKPCEIGRIDSDTIVIITISDYKAIANVFEDRNIKWFSWVEISREIALSRLDNLAQQQRKIFLLNTPDYLNLGDHAITIGEQMFISDVWGKRAYEFGTSLCNRDGIQLLKRYISPQDLILIQGGGNMGSLWKTCEENIRTIICEFSENKIIIFPQSIYYEDTESGIESYKVSRDIYSNHSNLLVCCRDRNSFEFVKNSYDCKSMLVPDMVLYLDYIKTNQMRKGIGLLLREDKEAYLKQEERNGLKELIGKMDSKVRILSHHKNEIYPGREERFKEMIDEYLSCELIITDRLHGMIFSVLTQTPCIVFDNSYKKISSLYSTWLKSNRDIVVMEEYDKGKIEGLIYSMIEKKANIEFNKDIINNAFDILKNYCMEDLQNE